MTSIRNTIESTSNFSENAPRRRGRRFNNHSRNFRSGESKTEEQSTSNQPNEMVQTNSGSHKKFRQSSNRGRGRQSRTPVESHTNTSNRDFHFNPQAIPFIPNGQLHTPSGSNSSNLEMRFQATNRFHRGRGGNNRGRQRRHNNSRDIDNRSLRDRLIYQLENNSYECAICYQNITTKQGLWACKTCYQMFHISNGCVINWAKLSRDNEDDNKWRCPTCQTKNDTMPYNYYCFCGKLRNPTYQLGETPHSCGEVCGGKRKNDCPHPCTDYCHPGPCSECQQQVTKSCNCGKIQKSVKCGSGVAVFCESVCGRELACGNHTCQQICHQGDCQECTVEIEQKCYCMKSSRNVLCNQFSSSKYICDEECVGFFDCGIHKCNKRCHDRGENGCGECDRGIHRITSCPCGKETLESMGFVRNTCEDPIPTCNSNCGKILECGSAGKLHRCQEKCHEGPCPPCKLNTSVQCRCLSSKQVMPCNTYLEILKTTGEYLCTKRCKKRKSCGIHKCQEVCCVQDDHFCMQICNKRLSCGLHTCDNICHAGQCRRCLNASFDEQYCHCGKTVRLPPIPCGSPLPACKEKCARLHRCGHPTNHNCHGDQNCPPCTYLTSKMCYGGHVMRKNIPCHIEAVSCGIRCEKPLKCGIHLCSRNCHGDSCEKEDERCKKKCEIIRSSCEHPCSLPCHGQTPCEPSLCRAMVKVNCECGRIKKEMSCWEFDRLVQVKDDSSVEPGQLKRSISRTQFYCIDCDEECKKLERNKRLAEALDIEIDENGESILPPIITFPCHLKEFLKSNADFVKLMEKYFLEMLEKLNDATNDQSIFRIHLTPMNVEKRRFIHGYAQYFKIDSESVDQPPKRSTMLTAVRGKAHQPLVLLSELLNFKSVLNTIGPSVIRKDLIDEAKKKKEEYEEVMKPLYATERIVYKRETRPVKTISPPAPVKQHNLFSVLGSDDDDPSPKKSEKKEVAVVQEDLQSNLDPLKDWWCDDESTGGWIEVKPKEYYVEVKIADTLKEKINICSELENLESKETWEEKFDKEGPSNSE